jgi:hypothetical protein
MKKTFLNVLRPCVLGTTLTATMLLTVSWTPITSTYLSNVSIVSWNFDGGNPIPGAGNFATTTFAVVDAETEAYIPANKVYNRYDALALRSSLELQQVANPNSLAINMALVKFHANAPNFSGGFLGEALNYAANIYKMNSYIGCLAYEYIYTKRYDFKTAEKWYKNSLINRLQEGMEWREIRYNNIAPFGVGVTGAFSNGRVHPLYENVWGTYTRKIMVPKCVGDCYFTIIPDFLKGSKQAKGELVFVNW